MDGFDRVHKITQETGTEDLVTTHFYDGNGNLRETRDAENRATRFVYDGLNRLRRIEHPLGFVSRMDYDGEGNKTEESDRRNVTTTFGYDNLGRLTRSEAVASITGVPSITTISYDDVAVTRTETDARNFAAVFEIDGQERVVQMTDPDGFEQNFIYDGVNKRTEKDKRGFVTEFEYDGLNRLTKVIDPLLQEMTTVYRDAERQVVETDKRGIVQTTQLDALGRLVSVTRSGVTLEQHEYDGNNNRIESTDANGNVTIFAYDGANRLLARTDGFDSEDETKTTFTYDRVGNLLTEKDGRVTGKPFDVRNTYDDLNRLRFVEDGEGNVTEFEYDGEGNRTAQIEPEGQRAEFDYGELNELIEVRMADTGVFDYDYDENRNRIRQTDGETHVVGFTYDKLNRLDLMIQDPDGFHLITDHDYDANGNETKLTDPKGQVVDFEYDELNRLEKKIYHLTAEDFALFTRTHEITFHYDPNDNLEEIDELKSSGTDPPAVISSFKTYDDLDRLESETDVFGKALVLGYDDQGNRTSLTDPDGNITEYRFDALNRLETVTIAGGITTYRYFPDGLKKSVTNPNSTVSMFDYDAADRMTFIQHLGPAGTISAYEYTYDSNGNRLSQIETNAGRTEETKYTYDTVNRLETVSYPDRTVAYEYDQAGNRTRELTTGAETSDETFHYDAINRLARITDTVTGAELTRYAYDANGNTISKTAGGVTTNFLFDIRDQLGEVQQGTNILGRYGYDYDGRRILKIGADGRRHYTYDQLSVVTEADETNATVSKYEFGPDQLLSLNNRNEGRSFFHLDILGSTVNLSQPNDSPRQSIFYDAWGIERERIGTSANNLTFTGHEKDEETGLIYAKARFYDPDVGRFLTQDDVLGQANSPPSLHRYFYANQNPLFFIDLDGRQSLAEIARREKERQKSVEATKELGNVGIGSGVAAFDPKSEPREANRSDLTPRTLEEQKTIGFRPDTVDETTVTEDLGIESTGDPFIDAELKRRKEFNDARRSIGTVGETAGKIGISLAAGTADDVTVLLTGRDLNEEEASRFLAAAGVILPGLSGAELRGGKQLAEAVTTQLRKNEKTGETITEIIVKFRSKGDAEEFARQLANQEQRLNRKSTEEIRQAIEETKKGGRPPEASAATRQFRRGNPDIPSGKVVTHEPDCCLGGDAVKDVTGVGGRAENSSIGSQNRHRRDPILEVLEQAGEDARVVFKFVIEGGSK